MKGRYARKYGGSEGYVGGLLCPQWLSDRTFSIFTTLFLIGLVRCAISTVRPLESAASAQILDTFVLKNAIIRAKLMEVSAMLGVIKMSVLAALVIPSAVKLIANDVANIERITGTTEKQPQAPNHTSDVEAIKAAKNTNVRLIERTLPDKRFDQWLRDLVGRQAQITWEVNDCGEQTGDPSVDKGRDFPMCAEAQVTLGGKRKLFVELCVGTFKTGVRTGPATLFYAIIIEPDGLQHVVKTLSGLPEAIKAIK